MVNDIDMRLRQVITSTLKLGMDPQAIKGESLVEELGMTSVDALEVLIRIEGEFGIHFEDEDLSQSLVSSLGNLREYVTRKMQ